MKHIGKTTCAILHILLLLFSPFAIAVNPDAAEVISELGLQESPKPISEHPGWQPRRVIASLPSWISQQAPDYEKRLRETATGVELIIDHSDNMVLGQDILAGADAVIGLCTLPTMENASENLLWLHNYSVGMDRCAGLSEDQVRGRIFTNNKRLSGPAIAEHSIAMLMSIARGLPAYHKSQANRQWDRSSARDVRFGELHGKTLLVAGLGGIGTEIAWRAHGLGMRVIATRNSSREGPDFVEYVGLADELNTLAKEAHVVVNALPLTEKTTGIFDATFFGAIKPGAIFLSVGRGRSTITADLIAALESGKLYGAGLDVTDPEPLPAESPLWAMDNVIITPHVSSAGGDSMRRTTIIAVENLRRYLAGEKLLNVVDMRAGY